MLLHHPVQDALFRPAGSIDRARIPAVRFSDPRRGASWIRGRYGFDLLQQGSARKYREQRARCVHAPGRYRSRARCGLRDFKMLTKAWDVFSGYRSGGVRQPDAVCGGAEFRGGAGRVLVASEAESSLLSR